MAARILCLHGMGASASIFEYQTVLVRSLLPDSYEFVFADGLLPCEAGENLAKFSSGPYLCWYTSPSTGRVTAAHEQLHKIIEARGPFDVIMGFSQGAALAASFLLHERLECPTKPPFFKAAIFICSPVPFSKSIDYGIDTRSYFGINALKPSRPACRDKVPEHLITDPAYLRGELEPTSDGGGELSSGTFYQMFHPTEDKCRIAIPTLHIYGRRDKWRLHSIDLRALCEPESSACLEHDGGHEIPLVSSEDMADAIESLLYKAC